MLGITAAALMVISLISGILTGSTAQVSQAAAEGCSRAVELSIELAGTMALWSGLMKVADKAGAAAFIQRLISPAAMRLFRGVDRDSPAGRAIGLNLTSNLLGLGNASTPLGIAAAKELNAGAAVHREMNTAMLVVLNTASIQLLPTTAAALRQACGSSQPYAVAGPVLLTSFLSAAIGAVTVKLLYSGDKQ
ncbi:MAG: spore maturation protein A [Ruminococcus sp.]|nr:spore maturation protein A [Ruminococcus sp.]